jgi:hypothetical protein
VINLDYFDDEISIILSYAFFLWRVYRQFNMDGLYLGWGFFFILFLRSWDAFSYSALSLGVSYGAGMCMDLSVELLH